MPRCRSGSSSDTTSRWSTSPALLFIRRRPPTEVRERLQKDAFVIADQARIHQGLGRLRPGDETAVDLRTLTARRTDLVNDRTPPARPTGCERNLLSSPRRWSGH
ncbi:transposase [Streptomyces sp. NPDC020794]|uniref:IS110 family transposase n=1 Tax=unclassified Streptomyces TaxID=2593676 RepID=UPI0036EC201C